MPLAIPTKRHRGRLAAVRVRGPYGHCERRNPLMMSLTPREVPGDFRSAPLLVAAFHSRAFRSGFAGLRTKAGRAGRGNGEEAVPRMRRQLGGCDPGPGFLAM